MLTPCQFHDLAAGPQVAATTAFAISIGTVWTSVLYNILYALFILYIVLNILQSIPINLYNDLGAIRLAKSASLKEAVLFKPTPGCDHKQLNSNGNIAETTFSGF